VLKLKNTRITDLTALEGLKDGLFLLDLTATPVKDISALKDLTNLMSLNLENTQVKDFESLAGLTDLTHLNLKGTQVTDLGPLTGLTKLEKLELGGTPVTKEEVQKLQKALPTCKIKWDGK